jgi:hypothetical protein
MVQSLDVLVVQTLARFGGERVRRASDVAEIEGIDQRTGEQDYASAYSWTPTDDSFSEGSRNLMDESREERGWSQRDLLSEMRRHRRFLKFLWDEEVTQYRRFTATVNRCYVLIVIGAIDRVLIPNLPTQETIGGASNSAVAAAPPFLLITYLVLLFLSQPSVGGSAAGMIAPLLPLW